MKLIGLRLKILIAFLIIALSTLVVTLFVSYYVSVNVLSERTENQLISEAYERANALVQVNSLRIEQLESLATSNEVIDFVNVYNNDSGLISENIKNEKKESLKNEISKFTHIIARKGFYNFDIMDKKGIVIFSSNKSLEGKNMSNNKFFIRGLKEPYRTIGIDGVNRITKTVVPIYDNTTTGSNVIGVIIGNTGTVYLDNILLNREGLGTSGESYLVDSDHILITPSRFVNSIFKQKVDTAPVRQCFESGTNFNGHYLQDGVLSLPHYISAGKGSFTYQDYRGIPVFGASYCQRDLGYVLLVEIDQQEALSPLFLLVSQYFEIGVIITILLIVITVVLTKKFVAPIKKLAKAVKEISNNNFNTNVDVSGTDEIAELSRTFVIMKNRLQILITSMDSTIKERTEELKNTNQELVQNQIKLNSYLRELSKTNAALNETSLVAITDIHGTITYANEKFCQVSKYTKNELIGQNHRILKSGFHPPEFYKELWQTISSGQIWRGEIKNKAKDGTYYWVKSVILPILDQNNDRPVEYIAVRTEITDRKDTEEQLQKSLNELHAVDRLKDEFVAMISHELRTPLIPIMGYCEMLLEHNISKISEADREVVQQIYVNSKRLRKMIDEILFIQKLEMDQIKFEKKEIDLTSYMKNIQQNYQKLALSKNILLTNSTDDKQIIYSDDDKLTQVLSNFILNAIDFTPTNGKIEIGAKKNNDDTVFYVKDNGKGIPKEQQKNLFKKFYQVDTSANRIHQGTGLGLSICKGLVEAMGGKIWVESEQGNGATFYFSIPKTGN